MSHPAPSLFHPTDPLRATAVLLNVLLFGIGLYFELHPKDRHDVWSAGAVAVVAVLNSATLTVRGRDGQAGRILRRLRRIALIANTLLLAAAALIVVLEASGGLCPAAAHAAALAGPPLVTIAALRRLARA